MTRFHLSISSIGGDFMGSRLQGLKPIFRVLIESGLKSPDLLKSYLRNRFYLRSEAVGSPTKMRQLWGSTMWNSVMPYSRSKRSRMR